MWQAGGVAGIPNDPNEPVNSPVKVVKPDVKLEVETPPGLVPVDVFAMGVDEFRTFDNTRGLDNMKLRPIPGRMLVLQGGRIIATIAMTLSSPGMAKWLHAGTSIYKAGVSVRYLTSTPGVRRAAVAASKRVHGASTGLEHSIAAVLQPIDDVFHNITGMSHVDLVVPEDWKDWAIDKFWQIAPWVLTGGPR